MQISHNQLKSPGQRVVIDGYSSPWTEITSGVPQGSILGPLFFAIFITDLCDVVCVDNTIAIALYADDSKMFRVINCAEDQIYFHEDKLHHWSLCNQMDFNTKNARS